MFLALKEIKKNKGKFILVAGISFLISYLVFFLMSLAYGLANANTSALEQWNAHTIVLKEGVNKNAFTSSVKITDLQKEDDKLEFISMGRESTTIGEKEKNIGLVLMGIDFEKNLLLEQIEGSKPTNSNEVIVSNSMKKDQKLKLGDTIKLNQQDVEVKIVGFSKEAKYNTAPVIYFDIKDTYKYIPFLKGEALINGSNDDNVEYASIAISQRDLSKDFDKYDEVSEKDFIDSIPGYTAQNMTFALMIGFLIAISALVLGVFMYIMSMQKQQIFAVMKVQGISNSYIGKSVIAQSLIINIAAIILGFLAYYGTKLSLPASVPIKTSIGFNLIVVVILLLTTVLGALLSVYKVTKVDPLEVLE